LKAEINLHLDIIEMKAAFAKMMEKNPTLSSHIAFRAGGNGVPILTRASGQSTSGYQTMGLPDGSRPMPGGGANKTSLGAFRMGDQDGNSPASAIYPGEIFGPPGQPDRVYPERTFANVGNNTFQPQNDDAATHALLKRLGDQQFKAVSQAPFEDYRAQQRLARDLDEASRNASLSDLGAAREIIRNLAAERRQQNEDDYLRKMLDAGATPEAARKEIEDVRNANALQEARKVDDREYQAKTLISRIAMSRGVTPMVKEPLNQSSSIDNPQRSQAMSQAMGMPGEGFGTSPLDANRQFMTPEFYKKYLRKTAMTQESADEQTAFNIRLAEGEIPPPAQGAYSMATLKGQERQAQVEKAEEALAARLETLRARGNRIIKPLPSNVIGKEVLNALYRFKSEKKPGNKVLYSLETIGDMSKLQLLIALNLATITSPDGGMRLHAAAGEYTWGTAEAPSTTLHSDLRALVQFMNKGESNIEIPFASAVMAVQDAKLVDILQEVKTSTRYAAEVAAAKRQYEDWLNIWDELIAAATPGSATDIRERPGASSNQFADLYVTARDDMTFGQAPTPGASGGGGYVGVPAAAVAVTAQLSLADKINARMIAPRGPTTLPSLPRRYITPTPVVNDSIGLNKNKKLISGGSSTRAARRVAREAAAAPPAAAAAVDYANMSYRDLQAALRARNMGSGGSKESLIIRLQNLPA
jgi:hypothetical protein